MKPIDPHAIVSVLLATAGLSPDPDEIDTAADGYPSLRASLDRMHDLLPDHEEEPELNFWATSRR